MADRTYLKPLSDIIHEFEEKFHVSDALKKKYLTSALLYV
jgi:hypothetical protein